MANPLPVSWELRQRAKALFNKRRSGLLKSLPKQFGLLTEHLQSPFGCVHLSLMLLIIEMNLSRWAW
jgi:hypothetical protein